MPYITNATVGIVERKDKAHIVSADCTDDGRETTLCCVVFGKPGNDFGTLPGWSRAPRFYRTLDCQRCAKALARIENEK